MHLNNLIKYITRPDKTDEQVLVSSTACQTKTAVRDFATVRTMSGKQRGLVAHQLVRSFLRGEVEPEQAQQMAEELAAKMLPGYQYIVCTHVDRDHIHTHIVFNSVSYLTGEKYYGNKKSLWIMREESDRLCRKYGLSVIDPSARSGLDRRTLEAAQRGGSWKVQLAVTLDDLIDRVTSRPELRTELERTEFHVERWTERDATIRRDGEAKAIRLSTLARQFGWQYSLPALQQRLLGEDLTPPAPPERPEAPAEASEWSRYQAWTFNRYPSRSDLRQRAQLMAKTVFYSRDPARAAAKALTLLLLERQSDTMEELRKQAVEKHTRIWRMPVSPAEVRLLRQSGLTVAFWCSKSSVGMYDACFLAEDLYRICAILDKDYAAERQTRIGQDAKADYAKLKADANRKGARIIYRVVEEILYRRLLQVKFPIAAFPKGPAYNIAFMESNLNMYERILWEFCMQKGQHRKTAIHSGGRDN